MSNNRHTIDDLSILGVPRTLEKGSFIPGFGKKYIVKEGWVTVITEGGAFKEILRPGTHLLNRYRIGSEIRATDVDMRSQVLTVSTSREFTITHPISVEINLDLAIEYRVADPRRIALEIKNPLTNLYDRVLQSARGAVSNATIDEIRRQGEGIAQTTLQRLQAMQLSKVIGLEVNNVIVTSIKATDVGGDALAAQDMKEYKKVRDWQLDSQITQNSQITWEWMLINRPEVAQQLIATYGSLAKEMIERGAVDPSGLLNQPTGNNTPVNPANLLAGFGFPATNANQPPQLTHGANIQLSGGTKDNHARMKEEIAYLKNLPGAEIDAKPGVDSNGVADNSYNLIVKVPRNSGGEIVLYVACLTDYPNSKPLLDIEVDGQDIPFDSNILRHWNGQYLVEIVREAKQRLG